MLIYTVQYNDKNNFSFYQDRTERISYMWHQEGIVSSLKTNDKESILTSNDLSNEQIMDMFGTTDYKTEESILFMFSQGYTN